MPSNYNENIVRLKQFKEGLFIQDYCRHMGKSLANAMLDHVVSERFLSQSFAIAELRLLNMEKLSRREYTVGFFNTNRFKIKVWLGHIAIRAGSKDAMSYVNDNIEPLSKLGVSSEDLMAVIGLGDKKNSHYEAIADAATKFVATTLANGFNEFNSKEHKKTAI
jgi:hypothetical protein